MRTIKSLRKNGEELGRGVEMYFAVCHAKSKGYKIPTKPIAALCGGIKEFIDEDGNVWEFVDTKEPE